MSKWGQITWLCELLCTILLSAAPKHWNTPCIVKENEFLLRVHLVSMRYIPTFPLAIWNIMHNVLPVCGNFWMHSWQSNVFWDWLCVVVWLLLRGYWCNLFYLFFIGMGWSKSMCYILTCHLCHRSHCEKVTLLHVFKNGMLLTDFIHALEIIALSCLSHEKLLPGSFSNSLPS